MESSQCLDEDALVGFVDGTMTATEAAGVEVHLAACASCRRAVSALGQVRTAREGPRKESAGAPHTTFGRYLVLEELGRGGLGEVWAAFDPQLGRKVALKMLRTDIAHGDDVRARIEREAQALARLSHPNVVAVFDAGVQGDRFYVAMELVDGETFRQWLGEPRPWREIVRRFRDAGRGLAAIHRAGLVHRDIKPDNLMIGRDDRILVMDLGLARWHDDGAQPGSPAADLPLTVTTRTGVRLGTPAYMAPEQHRGEVTGERSDQFSFCVALYEALYGQRPFAGESWDELARAIDEGSVREPPRDGRRVPPRLRDVVERGLAREPADRYPSMDALLADLERDPARRRWWIAGGAGVLAAGTALAVAWPAREDHAAACRATSAPLPASVWNPARRAKIVSALAGSAAARVTLTTALDAYAADWLVERADSCDATWERHEQSAELLDRRMDCLAQALAGVDALASVIEQDPAAVARTATRSAATLLPLAECREPARLGLRVPPSLSPDQRADLGELESQITRGVALDAAAKYDDARRVIEPAVARAREARFHGPGARGLLLHSAVEDSAGHYERSRQLAEEAALAAEAANDDRTRARAFTFLASTIVVRTGNVAEGRRFARYAQAAAQRGPRDDGLAGMIHGALASVAKADGKYEEALAEYREAIRAYERHQGPRSMAIVETRGNVAVVLVSLGRLEEAVAEQEAVLAQKRELLGAQHPSVGLTLQNLAHAQSQLERLEDAERNYRAALAVLLATVGAEHAGIAITRAAIGSVMRRRGRVKEAIAELEAAVALGEKALGREHRHVAAFLADLGLALAADGRTADAEARMRSAVAIAARALPAGHPDLARYHVQLAAVVQRR